MDRATSATPAEIYDRHFVPALFRHWGATVTAAAGIGAGHRVLDVACGTGALTQAALDAATQSGHVIGLDINEDMLEVARRKNLPIEWRNGRAEELPFADASFDAVVSQFGYMFFDDRVRALREMWRVLRPGGHLALAVCDALDHSPGYSVLAELLHRLFGEAVAQAFRAPFSAGDRQALLAAAEAAGIGGAQVRRHDDHVRFKSIKALLSAERACAWTLGGLLNDEQFEILAREAEQSLAPFLEPDGRASFSMPALILCAGKA